MRQNVAFIQTQTYSSLIFIYLIWLMSLSRYNLCAMFCAGYIYNRLQHVWFTPPVPSLHPTLVEAELSLCWTSRYKSPFMDIYDRQPPAISGILWSVQLARYDKKHCSSSEETSLSTTTKQLLWVMDKNPGCKNGHNLPRSISLRSSYFRVEHWIFFYKWMAFCFISRLNHRPEAIPPIFLNVKH